MMMGPSVIESRNELNRDQEQVQLVHIRALKQVSREFFRQQFRNELSVLLRDAKA
jgi:hypothetical protein